MTQLNIYKDLFDNRDEAIVIFDQTFNIVYHNQIFNTLFNTSDFKNLNEIFEENSITKIKKNSSLFTEDNSNNYLIMYQNKFFRLKSTFISMEKNTELDFTIITDESK